MTNRVFYVVLAAIVVFSGLVTQLSVAVSGVSV